MPKNGISYRSTTLPVLAAGLTIIVGYAGCVEQIESEPLSWHSPVIETLVKDYHTARNDIRVGDIRRALPKIDSLYLVRLDERASKLKLTPVEYLRRAVWDWPILSADHLSQVQADNGYIRLAFVTDTLHLSRDTRGQTTVFVLFRYSDRWRGAGLSRVVKPLADPFGYGYPQFVHETDLPDYMRFPRSF